MRVCIKAEQVPQLWHRDRATHASAKITILWLEV